MKRVAIVQPNYVPWRGYFDLIASVDEFILLDDVQYTSRDWRNRNRIKTARGVSWLTVPVHGGRGRLIREVELADSAWAARHMDVLTLAYRSAPGFERTMSWLAPAYEQAAEQSLLSEVDRLLIGLLCAELGIQSKLSLSSDYPVSGAKSRRLLELCLAAGADEYVTGPTARSYLETDLFERAGIGVRWFEYPEYQPYPQPHPPYEPRVSVLDLFLSVGEQARDHLPERTAAVARLSA